VLLDLKLSQVDFTNRVIRFVRLQNRKPVPMAAPNYGDMEEWLCRQKAFRDEHFPENESVFFWYRQIAKLVLRSRWERVHAEMRPALKSSRTMNPGERP